MNKKLRLLFVCLTISLWAWPQPVEAFGEGCAVYRTTAYSVPNITWTPIPFDVERWDDTLMCHVASGTTMIVAEGYAGWYMISGNIVWASPPVASYLAISLNSSVYIAMQVWLASSGQQESISTLYYLNEGDTVQLFVYQSSGASRNISAVSAYSPEFRMVRVGPGSHSAFNSIQSLPGVASTPQNAGLIRGVAISTATPALGQSLVYSGSIWMPAAVAGSDSHDAWYIRGVAISTATPALGQSLVYTGTNWRPGTITPQFTPTPQPTDSHDAWYIRGVAISTATPALGQSLVYTGTNWRPGTITPQFTPTPQPTATPYTPGPTCTPAPTATPYTPGPPLPHHETHEDGGSDEININGLDGIPSTPLPTSMPGPHGWMHETGGPDEINVSGLFGILADPQDAGWFHGLAITTTGVSDGQVLAWNEIEEEWRPITMPDIITATISGTVPVVITSTYQYTQMLSSEHDIAVIRSFTFGEASIAIGLLIVAALLGLNLLFELLK